LKFIDGTVATIKEVYDNLALYINKKLLSCNSDGSFVETSLQGVSETDSKKEFLKITFEDNSIIEVTPEHRIMLADGTFKQACELTENDEIMSI